MNQAFVPNRDSGTFHYWSEFADTSLHLDSTPRRQWTPELSAQRPPPPPESHCPIYDGAPVTVPRSSDVAFAGTNFSVEPGWLSMCGYVTLYLYLVPQTLASDARIDMEGGDAY